jgi:DNA repair protein RadC
MGYRGKRRRSIKELPRDLLPREKMLAMGEEALSEEELWAVVLGSGTKGFSVLEIATELSRLGFERLKTLSVEEISKIPGVGKVKALTVKAVVELCRRHAEGDRAVFIRSPEDAVEVVKPLIRGKKEHLFVLSLSIGQKLLHTELVAVGGLNVVRASPREVFRPVVASGGYFYLLVHNHPDGSAEPSREDLDFTRAVERAGNLLGLELLDHVVIGEDGFVSMRERGLIGNG